MTVWLRIRRWILRHRMSLISFCVGCLLIFSLPSLLSTTWGGYCLQRLICASTRFEIKWKQCSIGWFTDTHIEDLSLIDRRAQSIVNVKRIDSTWRPGSLFFSPRSIGTTSVSGAHITLSLPNARTEEWPYPFIPSSLPASRKSKLPAYGILHIEGSRFTCKITQNQEITLENVTGSLLVPAKKGNIICSLSARSSAEEGEEPGTLNLLVEYQPTKPRRLLQTNGDLLRALGENRLHLDAQIHHFPSLLLDTLLRIRHPHNTTLISSAVGPLCDCNIQTELHTETPHLSMDWNSPLVKGACSVAFSDSQLVFSTQQPIEWTFTPDLLAHLLHTHAPLYYQQLELQNPLVLKFATSELMISPQENASGEHLAMTGSVSAQMSPVAMQITRREIPLHLSGCNINLLFTPDRLHWDAQMPFSWEGKQSLISSSGDSPLPLVANSHASRTMKISLETMPSALLDFLLKQEGKIEGALGDTVALHFSMEPDKGQKNPTHTVRILCLASKLQCSPIEFSYGSTLKLLNPVHFQLMDPSNTSKALDFTCDRLTSSPSSPCEAHFTLPIGKIALSLSSIKLPHLVPSSFKLAGQAIFFPNDTDISEGNQIAALLGSSLTCAFSTTYDPKDTKALLGEFAIKGETLTGNLTCKWLNEQTLDLTSSSLVWKVKPQHFAALKSHYPFLKEWTLYEEATCVFTTQNGPLPLSVKRLKEEGRLVSMYIDFLPILHIPSQHRVPLKLQGFLNEKMHARLQGSILVGEGGITPTFMCEGFLNASNISGHFTANQIPTSLLHIPLHTQPEANALSTWLVGNYCNVQGSFATTPETRLIDLHLTSASGIKLDLDATQQIDAMRYILNRPGKLTIPLSLFTRPIPPAVLADKKMGLSRLFKFTQQIQETNGSLSLTLSPEMAFLRLPFRSWEDVEIGQLALEVGEITLKTPTTKSALSGILHKAIQARKRSLSVLTTPLFFSLSHGKLQLKRVDVLIAGRYPIAFWGRFKIPKNHFKGTLAISATALRAGYGLSDISPGYFLLLPMSGTAEKIALHRTKALTRLTALSLHSGGGIPGAFLGSFAHWLSGGFDSTQVPPPTSPIPWASLDEELKQEELEMAQKQGNSLPSTLIAPFQAVHRGIQKGVRKGADLLFNLLRAPK